MGSVWWLTAAQVHLVLETAKPAGASAFTQRFEVYAAQRFYLVSAYVKP